jgi:hypothetical protein
MVLSATCQRGDRTVFSSAEHSREPACNSGFPTVQHPPRRPQPRKLLPPWGSVLARFQHHGPVVSLIVNVF